MPQNQLSYGEFISPIPDDVTDGIENPRYNNFYLHFVEGNLYRTFPWSTAYQKNYPERDRRLVQLISPIANSQMGTRTFLEQIDGNDPEGRSYEELLYDEGYLLMRQHLPPDQPDEILFQ